MLSNLNRRRFLRTAAGVLVPAPFVIGQSLRSPAFVARLTGGVPVFTKDTISGMQFWYDASTLTDGDGSVVSTWSDQSGNGRDLTATTTLRPTLRSTGGPNSKPACEFSGAQGMGTSAFNINSTGYTVFCVAKTSVTNADQMIYETSVNLGVNNGTFAGYFTADNKLAALHQYAGFCAWISTGTVGTGFKYITHIGNFTLPSNEVVGYVNGVSAGGYTANINTGGTLASFPLFVGARNKASMFLTGFVSELMAYNSAFDATNRQTVEAYLKTKYAL